MCVEIKDHAVQGVVCDQSLISFGQWCLSQSRRATSMRVCQPLPVDLKASMTSGEYRIVVDFLVGSKESGLPRRMTNRPSFKLAFSKKKHRLALARHRDQPRYFSNRLISRLLAFLIAHREIMRREWRRGV